MFFSSVRLTAQRHFSFFFFLFSFFITIHPMSKSPTLYKVQLFGIPNCDSVKKARVWLDSKGIEYEFQDFKKSPPTLSQLKGWCTRVDWETLVNKKSTTWRSLPKAVQARVKDESSACEVLLEFPSLIKRPVIWSTHSSAVIVGVQPLEWESLIA